MRRFCGGGFGRWRDGMRIAWRSWCTWGNDGGLRERGGAVVDMGSLLNDDDHFFHYTVVTTCPQLEPMFSHINRFKLQAIIRPIIIYQCLSFRNCFSCSSRKQLVAMSFAKSTLIFAILCLILVQELEICEGNQDMDAVHHHHHLYKIDCGGKCSHRCSKASKHKRCMRACNSCCQRCHCVPPGTYGNKHVCPCYAKLTTHGGKLKCP
ncbi:uncharacterized protein LOC130719890 [Lotus japonicus]|uniref:uncharacterized protein LOC130719890 n=1 Tax=Lotus japonicus TaxID=34305 RepID=UPI002586895A|nr:uncharacterized protein LOC130719890 [Lotus japonicus]